MIDFLLDYPPYYELHRMENYVIGPVKEIEVTRHFVGFWGTSRSGRGLYIGQALSLIPPENLLLDAFTGSERLVRTVTVDHAKQWVILHV